MSELDSDEMVTNLSEFDAVPSVKAALERIKFYQAWRRGADVDQPCPLQVGKDLDALIEFAEAHL